MSNAAVKPQPQANSKPRAALVVRREDRRSSISILRLIPAALLSALFHVGLIGVMFLLSSPSQAEPPPTEQANVKPIEAEPPPPPERQDPFLTSDVDPSAMEFDTDINYNNDRLADVSIPGLNNPLEDPGILNAKEAPPVNLPPPAGFGMKGQGGSVGDFAGTGLDIGTIGGYGAKGVVTLPGGFGARGASGATRQKVLREGGGTGESEAAVALGLKWIARNQHPEGKWQLDGNFPDRGSANDIAGTAFGLLPLLAAGKTHKAGPENPFDKPIEKALFFLIRRQNKRTGDFGGGMYAHGIATIAMCEAYGLTQDPNLRRPAQMAVNYIVQAQHKAGGGWRYSPGQPGDTSVVGWQVMALKSAQMSGLEVPSVTLAKAVQFLNSVNNSNNQGYGYVNDSSTPTMSAVGLLCRQYLQSWGPQNINMIKGIENNIKRYPPGAMNNMYYYYYATQVMHHFGGQAWKDWNDKMRDKLVKSQVKGSGPDQGSWNSAGDAHASSGGRLMHTSLCLLTLEVYYRHLPLFHREAVYAAENK